MRVRIPVKKISEVTSDDNVVENFCEEGFVELD